MCAGSAIHPPHSKHNTRDRSFSLLLWKFHYSREFLQIVKDKSQNITKTVFPNDVSDAWKKGEQNIALLRSILRERWRARAIARLKRQALIQGTRPRRKTVFFKTSLPALSCTLFCFTCESKCFYWLVVHMHLNNFRVLCTVKANERQI